MKRLWWRTKWFFADRVLGLRIRLARGFYWIARKLDYLVDADEYLRGYESGLGVRMNQKTSYPADDPEQAKENFYKTFPGHTLDRLLRVASKKRMT